MNPLYKPFPTQARFHASVRDKHRTVLRPVADPTLFEAVLSKIPAKPKKPNKPLPDKGLSPKTG